MTNTISSFGQCQQMINIPTSCPIDGRPETAQVIDSALPLTGGVNQRRHLRGPVPLDALSVFRDDRDTLYISAIIGIRKRVATRGRIQAVES